MPEEGLVKLGWNVPISTKENFVEFCEQVGSRYQEACAGALAIWQYLPAEIRENAKLTSKGINQVDEEFWKQFRAGLDLAIKARSSNPQ